MVRCYAGESVNYSALSKGWTSWPALVRMTNSAARCRADLAVICAPAPVLQHENRPAFRHPAQSGLLCFVGVVALFLRKAPVCLPSGGLFVL